MNDHLDVETISAYLDQELGGAEIRLAEAHLAGCARCASQMGSLQEAASALAGVPRVEITPDEHRALRQAVLSSRSSSAARWPLLSPRRVWAVAGALSVVLIAVVGFAALRPSNNQMLDRAAAPESAPQTLDFTSGDQVQAAVAALPEVSGRTERKGGEAFERRATDSTEGATSEAPAPAAPLTAQGSQPPEEAAGGGEGSDAAVNRDSAARSAGDALDFSAQAADRCLDKVADAGPGELVPLTAREAKFQGRPAWLLVYSSAPVDNRSAPPDRVEVWLVTPGDCLTYSGASLLGRALYHSSFDRP
jgi:hypothetical protein